MDSLILATVGWELPIDLQLSRSLETSNAHLTHDEIRKFTTEFDTN